MHNRRLLMLVAGLSLVGFLGLTGCKNVCEKAADHMKGCVEEYCAEAEEGDPICEAMQGETQGEMPECTAEVESQAQAMLDKSCDELFGRTGGSEGGE